METAFAEQIRTTFEQYKCLKPQHELCCIPVYDANSHLIAWLKPVTFHWQETNPEFAQLFSRWREENPIGFANIFKITPERTSYWLENLVLRRDDRILFVIEDLKGQAIGHLGLSSFDYEQRNAEIDNVVRGRKSLIPGLMQFATWSLSAWALKRLELDTISLRVLSDNDHAIRFYERCGFDETGRIPLYKVETKDELKWIDHEPFPDASIDRYYVVMKLNPQVLQDHYNHWSV
jgi:RimJ/RimL family protein N-acetyltransferase